MSLTTRYSAYLVEGHEVTTTWQGRRGHAGNVSGVWLLLVVGVNHLKRARRVLKRSLGTAAARLPGPLGGPRLTVVVIARGRADSLDACLSSVLASSHRNLDVLLVADDGDHATRRAIRGRGTSNRRVQVLDSSDGSGLDRAVAQAEGAYVAFVDAEDIVPPNAYRQLLAVLRDTGSDFVVGQQFRQEGGRFTEIPWSAPLLAGARRSAEVDDVPQALADAGHGNRLFTTEFWRGSGMRFGESGLRAAQTVMTEAYLRCRSFDIAPVRSYDECARDGSRPIAEQRRYQSPELRGRLDALLTSARLVHELASDAYTTWLVTVLDRVLPTVYADAVVADEAFFRLLSDHVRELLRSAPDVLASVPVQARVSAWLAANAGPADLALMAEHVADNPHGLPARPEQASSAGNLQVVLPDAIDVEIPDRVRRVLPVDLKPHTRLTRVTVSGSTVDIEGAAFLEYGRDSVPPRVELVGSEGKRHPLRTRSRHDPDVNRWSARAWEDHSGAGFIASGQIDDVVPVAVVQPSDWAVEITLVDQDTEITAPLLPLDPGGLPSHEPHLSAAGESAALVVDTAAMELNGLRITGTSRITGPTRWRVVGDNAASTVTESVAAHGRFTARLDLTRTLWGQDGIPLQTGRYRIEATDSDGSRNQLRWGEEAATGIDGDLLVDRYRLEVHQQSGGGVDIVVHHPVPADARGVYAQNQLRNAYSAARSRPPVDTVLFESFGGLSTGDNPGAICAEMLRRGIDLDLVWLVDDPSLIIPRGTRAVARRTPEWYDLMATARGYVSNAGAPYYFRKRSDQVHLQTWHGTPLKRIGEDRPPDGFEIWRHNKKIRSQAANWDALVSSSQYCSETLRSAFKYDGVVLESGLPRNDVLLSEQAAAIRAGVRATLCLDEQQRVVLYAPTWRDYAGAKEGKPLYLDADLLVQTSPDTVVLVRGHYSSSNEADAYPGRERILDVTRFPDIAGLFLAADVLVTDYSSVMFDFALTDKPIILLVPDLHQYRDVERGFYFDIEAEAPGPMVRSTQEVLEALVHPDQFADLRDQFRRRFCAFEDGHASARVVDDLLERM